MLANNSNKTFIFELILLIDIFLKRKNKSKIAFDGEGILYSILCKNVH